MLKLVKIIACGLRLLQIRRRLNDNRKMNEEKSCILDDGHKHTCQMNHDTDSEL